MSKVYVTQEASFDFVPAEQYGEIEFLTRHDLHNIRNSLHNRDMIAEVSGKLMKFNPDEDYIVIAGSPYVAAMVFWLLGRMQMKTIRVLRWSNRDRLYVPMYIEL